MNENVTPESLRRQLAQERATVAKLQAIVDRLFPPQSDGFVLVSYKHGYVGNCVQFWREGGAGYTTTLAEAGVFGRDTAMNIQAHSEKVYAIPVVDAVSMAVAHIDGQRNGGTRQNIMHIAARAAKEKTDGE